MRTVRVVICGQDTVVGERIRVADHSWHRFWGLMGTRDLPDGDGMLFPWTNAVHGFFMRYPLAVVYLDCEGRVLVCVQLAPWRIGPIVRRARWVLELPVQYANILKVGDQLEWSP